MNDTVALLKANKTFAPWSTWALGRLYFWFSRRRYASRWRFRRVSARLTYDGGHFSS